MTTHTPTPDSSAAREAALYAWSDLCHRLDEGMTSARAIEIILPHFAPLLARQTAEAEALRKELAYFKEYVVPEKDKHGKYWHDLAQERVATIAAQARELEQAKACISGNDKWHADNRGNPFSAADRIKSANDAADYWKDQWNKQTEKLEQAERERDSLKERHGNELEGARVWLHSQHAELIKERDQLRAELATANNECIEKARLLGLSESREAGLRADLDTAQREVTRLTVLQTTEFRRPERYSEISTLRAELARLRERKKALREACSIAAEWIEQCPFDNAIPHAEKLRALAAAANGEDGKP